MGRACDFGALDADAKATLQRRLTAELRTPTYDKATGTVVVSADRAAAIAAVATHYEALFGNDPALRPLRGHYAMQESVVPDATRRRQLTAFFFWTSWAASTNRPDSSVTYTNNWPHEPLIGNVPTSANVLWSIISIVLLLAGAGALIWWQAFRSAAEPAFVPPAQDPLSELVADTVDARGRQVRRRRGAAVHRPGRVGRRHRPLHRGGAGVLRVPAVGVPAVQPEPDLAHPDRALLDRHGVPGRRTLPGAGNRRPRARFQRLGVNVLFGALLLVVTGSLAGEALTIHQKLGLDMGFWFGHQGYEYVDLGRAWQIALFSGLLIWLALMLRGLAPALARRDSARPLVMMFAGASVAVGLMYGAGFFFGARTHLSVMEYWRWWVVHLWVEGFFEVFATAALALIFSRLGLVNRAHAGAAVVASSALFLFGGIPGTFHHLYFSGTPTSIMAVGATFSALEVIPLILIGYEAYQTSRLQHATTWMRRYRWPIRFFVGVAFWNFLGAGVFGFLINPPIALYYMQGLNTTPVPTGSLQCPLHCTLE